MLRTYVSSVCPGSRTFPVSRKRLAGFIVHLFRAKYASSTILSTVSAIAYSHKIVGLEDPADDFYIKKLLVGIQKKSRTVDLRRPIDLEMLSNLVSATKAIISDKFTQLCIAAMFMLAFHGFVRIGEITLRPGISSQHVLQRSDLVIVSGGNTSAEPSLQLTIRHAKHQQVNRPVVLQITSQPSKCPVVKLIRYLRIRGTSAGPLFIFPDDKPITRSFFASQLPATRNNYRKNDDKYARAVRVAIEFGWARLLVVTGTLPGTRFTKMFAI